MAGVSIASANISFFKWRPDIHSIAKPFEIAPKERLQDDSPLKAQLSNISVEDVTVDAEDIRGNEAAFSLDNQGFQVFAGAWEGWNFDAFGSKHEIEHVYVHMAEKLLKDQLDDVKEVFTFDWRLRSSAAAAGLVHVSDQVEFLPPSQMVHVGENNGEPVYRKATDLSSIDKDQTPAEIIRRCHDVLGEDALSRMQKRVRVVNVWRPFSHEVEDQPLVLCDGSTAENSDLVKTDIILGNTRPRETYNVCHSPLQKWYYLSKQTPEEALLIKIFDSNENVKAKCSPHTSFRLQDASPTARPRQSIEVRCLVFS